MSGRRIAVLALLVAALGAYLWFYEAPRAAREGKKDKLVGVEKDQITGITLTYPDREIALRKDDKGWRLAKPVDAAADDAAVTSLLGTIADTEVQRTLDETPADLAPFGLDKPVVTVALTLKSGEVPPIAVGKNTAIGGKTYVRKGEEAKIYLTPSSIAFALKKEPKDLRDKQLFTFQDDDVQKVELLPASGAPVTLVRKDKDAWVVEPGDYPADGTEVRSYLSSLRGTRAVDFPDDAPADLATYGLDKPRLTVRVATGKDGATTQAVLLGNEKTEGTQKQVYARRDSALTVYALGDWSFRTLNKDVKGFRDKTILGFDTSRVGRAVLTRKDGTTVTLVRGEGGWQLEGTDAKKTKATTIDRFLDDLKDLRGSDIAAEPVKDGAAYGLNAPDLRIVLTDKEGQPMGTVLAAKHDGKYYAMREGAPTVFEARDYMFTRLDKQQRDFVESEPAATPPTTVPDEDEAGEMDEDEAGAVDEDEP